jgi:hypothetical protein
MGVGQQGHGMGRVMMATNTNGHHPHGSNSHHPHGTNSHHPMAPAATSHGPHYGEMEMELHHPKLQPPAMDPNGEMELQQMELHQMELHPMVERHMEMAMVMKRLHKCHHPGSIKKTVTTSVGTTRTGTYTHRANK